MIKLKQLLHTNCPHGVKYIKIGEVVNYEQPSKYIVQSTDYKDEFKTPVLTAGQSFILGYTNETAGIYKASKENPVIIFDDFTGAFKWVDFPFKVKSSAMKMLTTSTKDVLLRYIYHVMGNLNFTSDEHKRLWISVYSEFQIPVPPLPAQEEIVRILDKFTELEAELAQELAQELAHRKLQYTFYRDKLLSFESPITTKTIGEICAIKRGKVISKDYIREHSGVYPVYSSQTENDGVLGLIDSYDYDGEYLTWTTDGANAGTVFHRTGKFNITNVCGLLKPIDASVNTRYLYYILGNVASKHVEKGMGNPKLMSNVMESIKVPIPSLNVQQRLVKVLDNFDSICSDLSIGLPAEIAAREKAYIYYRDFLLNYTANGLDLSRAQQSTAEHSRAQQSTAEQKLIAYVFGMKRCA